MLLWIVATLLIFSLPVSTALDYNDFSLQRIARAPHPSSALLVPYPRVGKRSNILNNNSESQNSVQKRLYMARVGKRAFFYTPRIGK
ncbi:LYMARV-amide [Caenorhabditis elegans]|uniref:Neuropeptide precursor capa-1 n=1 Tax=Caenorhabditis elegans TaxID=6239 RepID=CAPAR_CAEEL|nr:LYMARV-amide [Caenorhabditis elegans]Q9N563.1 RecName: Full=Neuropeptide precursor capa-1; AltName: Full=CAPA (insect neuropeptide) related protein; Contains: RecName: Full=AFFYTPRI-amide; Short=PK-like; Short=pyrokinin-like; Contains: RecName: Full=APHPSSALLVPYPRV-amide; Short=PVK-1; Contains: RecName: Full=LYMARV-amide; Short=PVK-2; Flags: Precursor [Caenorhabditis elegans]CCD67515.1 LYMARV-amide [Caenorhabditis elegans]|eukprot:NP_508991.1 CAPA (insect neuropeptide) related [Caenorhabditis elegans]